MNELRNTINIQFSVHGTVAARLNISNHIRLVGFKRLISLLFSVNTTTNNNNKSKKKIFFKTTTYLCNALNDALDALKKH